MDLNQDENALLEYTREAREEGETKAPKAEELGIGIEGAYKVQAALGEGREVVGYKLGLIKPEGQAQMGMDSPIYGRAYKDMILASPVGLGSLLQPQLEPELAVVLGKDLPPRALPGAGHAAIGGIIDLREIMMKPGRREAMADQEDWVIHVALDVAEENGVV